ncbi:MAG TPA: hypothetical protein VGR58_00375 [Candidatus Acidoferrum sp.]|nr:hypothetical protein [Candidatus Acidoferrum sp.]
MRKLASLALSLFLLTGTAFADSPKDSPKDATKEAAATPAKPAAASAATKTTAELAAQMEELRQALIAQQEQLQMLKEELAKRDRQIEEAREAAASANARATEANTKAVEAVTTSAEVKSTATALNSTVANLAAGNAAVANSAALTTRGDQKADEDKGPLAIRFKGVTITPGGFVAAESSFRQRTTSGDVNTPFTGIPYPGNALSKVTENNFTGRQSRLSMLVEGKISNAKLTGYVETDFLGTGVTSNNRQSNSYVLRQRQFWGRIDLNSGWSFTGGQMWSLATENQKGIVNRAEWIPLTIDAQYQVGFNWARQYGLRATKTFNDKFAVAASIEGAQATIGGRGFTSLSTTNESTASTSTVTNFFFNAPGNGGGLFNFVDTSGYTINKLPDFIVKAAWDPGFGHYEVVGILSEFRDRIYPCAVASVASPCTINAAITSSSAFGAFNDSRTGGGFEASARLPLFNKKLDAALKGGYGVGTGRYASAQLADLTARPDGVLVPIHAANFLGRLEWHASPKLDIYGYYGGEYAARTAYSGYTSIKTTVTPAIPGCGDVGQPACPSGGIQPAYPSQTIVGAATTGSGGYGFAGSNNSGCSTETSPANTGPAGSGFPSGGGSCAGDIRYIAEGTLGFWHKAYQGEKGRVQWGIQYSYIYKIGWSGSGGGVAAAVSPKAVDNMVFTSFRYYLP